MVTRDEYQPIFYQPDASEPGSWSCMMVLMSLNGGHDFSHEALDLHHQVEVCITGWSSCALEDCLSLRVFLATITLIKRTGLDRTNFFSSLAL